MTILSKTTAKWAVVFDLDGLLVDSEPIQKESFNLVLAKYGIRLEEKDFRPLVGQSTRDNFEYLKRRYGITEDVEVLLQKKAEAYETLTRLIRPMPGAIELVRSVTMAGIPAVVASSSPKRIVERSLEAAGFDMCFDALVGGDEVARPKPAPDVYIKAIEVLGLPGHRCVALEDSPAGVEAAVSAGLRCVAVPNCYTKGAAFDLADLVVASLRELDLLTLWKLVEGKKPKA